MEGEPGAGALGVRVKSAASLAAVAGDWDALATRTAASPFQRPGWIAAWLEAFGSGDQVVLTAHRGDELVGVLPLQDGGGALTAPANWHTPEFGPVAADAEAARALVMEAVRRARRRVDISFLSRAGAAAALAAGIGAGEGRILIRTIERSPWVALDGSWEDFEAAMPARRRADLRRRNRRLEEEIGKVEWSTQTGAEGLGPQLAEGFAVEASGWKGERGTAISADPAVRGFYEAVAAWAARTGLLSLWFLRAGGRAVAFAFCIRDAEAHHVLKIGFDPAYSRYAPGMLLTRAMLHDAFVNGLRRYEFLGQDDAYKLVWTDRLHERERLQVFPRGAAGTVDAVAWRHGRPLAKRLLRR